MTKISTQGQRGKSAAERFAEKFHPGEGCWNWTSAIGSRGYGIFWHGAARRSVMAHRFALELAIGREIPSDQVVMHSCDNPKCVNPEHLSLGSIRDNAIDARDKGRLAVGEKNGGGKKLTADQVRGIRARMAETSGQQEAIRHGVSRYVVNAIRRGDIWKHVDG